MYMHHMYVILYECVCKVDILLLRYLCVQRLIRVLGNALSARSR